MKSTTRKVKLDKDMAPDEFCWKIFGSYRELPEIYRLNPLFEDVIRKGTVIEVPVKKAEKKPQKKERVWLWTT